LHKFAAKHGKTKVTKKMTQLRARIQQLIIVTGHLNIIIIIIPENNISDLSKQNES